MLPNISKNQLTEYYEAEMRKHGNQKPERGYSGIGYWWYGYPVYVGTLAGNANMTTALPHYDQAPLDENSKLAGAAEEAGAVTSGINQGSGFGISSVGLG